MGVNIVARLLGFGDEPEKPEREKRVKGYYKIPKPVVENVAQDDEVVEDESE